MTQPRQIPARMWVIMVLPFAVAACAGILGVRKTPARAFEHRAHVVHGISCVKCHAQVARSDAQSPIDLPPPSTCTSCHQKPHNAGPVRQLSRPRSRSGRGRRCQAALAILARSARCKRQQRLRALPQHGAARPGTTTAGHGDLPRCHEHREQWAARQCLPCHRNLEDEHVRPTSHVVHGPNFLAQHGAAAAGSRELCASCHEDSACAACHGVNVPALPQTLTSMNRTGRTCTRKASSRATRSRRRSIRRLARAATATRATAKTVTGGAACSRSRRCAAARIRRIGSVRRRPKTSTEQAPSL